MNAGFALRMALREGRAGVRRIGAFMLAIALGVAALTGLHAFQMDAADGARAEARSLLGGDLRIQSTAPFGAGMESLLDSLRAQGFEVSRSVTLGSMVSDLEGTSARLLQVNAVDSLFPVAGSPDSEPAGAWEQVRRGGAAVAERATLLQIGADVGDSLQVAGLRLSVVGTVTGLPIDPGIQSVVGPPIYIALADLEETDLLDRGSLAQHRAFLAVPNTSSPAEVARFLEVRIPELDDAPARVSVRTAQEEAEALADGFQTLARFLGLVGFMALLLGGVGVASAVQLYVEERMGGIAVLRCLGAGQNTVFGVYIVQTLLLGATGALLGVLLGVAIQFALPVAFAGMLPFRFDPVPRPGTMVLGMLVGTGVAVIFALIPLLRVREIPPLAAFRLDVEREVARRGLPRVAAAVGIGGSMLTLAILQMGGVVEGIILTVALGGVLLVLWGLSLALVTAARRLVPGGASFPVRQGVAGLFRPGNQTGIMLTSLGFGAFLLASLVVVSEGLRDWLSMELSDDAPALLMFDIQTDQREEVEALLAGVGVDTELIPIVPARLDSVDAMGAEALRTERNVPEWILRRTYRNTALAELRDGERMVDGAWWDAPPATPEIARRVEEGAVRISLDAELAEELGAGLGSVLDWNVQGRPIRSVVASTRVVDWSRFQPNFFVIFEPGALDGAPTTWIGLAPLAEESVRIGLQRSLLSDFSNVSFIDLSVVRETVLRISSQVTRLLGGMALFALAGGYLVILATLLTGRFRRRAEAALIRTLGGTSRTVRHALLIEYTLLGAIGGAAGIVLGAGGGMALLRWGFDLPAGLPLVHLSGIWAGLMALTLLSGWSVSGPILRDPPLAILRQES